jgi:hypothetical protein
MKPTTVLQFLDRACSALDRPTLYVLGEGPSLDGSPDTQPGTPFDAASLVRALRTRPAAVEPKVRQYFEEAVAAGVDLDQLPALACDCSGYVAWCLGLPRTPSVLPGNSFWTNGICADADRPGGVGQLFRRLPAPVPGALLVYPGRQDRGEGGHVAIVCEVQGGQVTGILHCAPQNFLLAPEPGRQRNAIARTDPAPFQGRSDVRVVMACCLQD